MPFSYRASVMAKKGTSSPPPATGVLYTAGFNNYGQLGDGTTTDKSVLTVIGSGFSNATIGYGSSLALKSGTLWSWGNNTYGGLGLGDTTNRSSPVQVGTASDWGFIHVVRTDSDSHCVGFRSSSPLFNLYIWGNNLYGQLGLGDTTNRSSPVQLGSNSDWWMVSMGYGNTLGIRSSVNDAGTLWAWGFNQQGQLGLNNTTNYSSPVQVGTRSDWQIITCGDSFSVALTYDYYTGARSLWTWGSNDAGQLGTGNTNYYSSPVQVGSDTTWLNVSAGAAHCVAIKTDGTLWTWGYNSAGQLGLGDAVDRSSPVQVGSDTDWAWVYGGIENTMATKNDGTIWVWGAGYYGAFGVASAAYSSPVQLGSFSNYPIPSENFSLPIHSIGDASATIRDET